MSGIQRYLAIQQILYRTACYNYVMTRSILRLCIIAQWQVAYANICVQTIEARSWDLQKIGLCGIYRIYTISSNGILRHNCSVDENGGHGHATVLVR